MAMLSGNLEQSQVTQLKMSSADAVVVKIETTDSTDVERLEVWADGNCVFVVEAINGQVEIFQSEIIEIKR